MFYKKCFSTKLLFFFITIVCLFLLMHRHSHANHSDMFSCSYQLERYNNSHQHILQLSQLHHYVCDCDHSIGYALYEYDDDRFTDMCPAGCSAKTIKVSHHIACEHNPKNWRVYSGNRAICNTDKAGTHQNADGCQIDYY